MNIANFTRRCKERDLDVVSRLVSDVLINSDTASPKLVVNQNDVENVGSKLTQNHRS